MQPQRFVGFGLIVVGVVLLAMGISASDSFGSQVSRFFTGSPTDRAVWLTIGGIIAILAGGAIMMPYRPARP